MEFTNLVLLQHHKVKVLNPFIAVISHPFQERGFTDNLADILVNKVVPAFNER